MTIEHRPSMRLRHGSGLSLAEVRTQGKSDMVELDIVQMTRSWEKDDDPVRILYTNDIYLLLNIILLQIDVE